MPLAVRMSNEADEGDSQQDSRQAKEYPSQEVVVEHVQKSDQKIVNYSNGIMRPKDALYRYCRCPWKMHFVAKSFDSLIRKKLQVDNQFIYLYALSLGQSIQIDD